MERLVLLGEFFQDAISRVNIRVADIVEMLILAFLIYHILVWIQNTRAWVLFKGMIVIGTLLLIAVAMQMNTILWIAENVFSVAITAVIMDF